MTRSTLTWPELSRRQSSFVSTALAAFAIASCSPETPSSTNIDTASQAAAEIGDEPAIAVEPVDLLALPDGPLGIPTLEAYIAAFRDYEPADEFSPREFDDSVLAGREFAFELSKSEWLGQGGLWYGYDAEKNQLKLQLSLADARHYQGKTYQPDFQYVPFTYVETEEGAEVGSNAFGVAGSYKVSHHERYGVGIASEEAKLGLFPKEGGILYGSLRREVAMTPDEARAATQGLKVRLAGTLTTDPEYKSVIACNRDKTKPTFDYPYNENWRECVVSGTFTLIEIVSPTAGVLASWGKK